MAMDALRWEGEAGAKLVGDGVWMARWAGAGEVPHPVAGDATNRITAVSDLVV